MNKLTAVFVLFLVSSVPTFAKPPSIYPASCPALWESVKITLADAGNYNMLAADDAEMSASFIVVGAQRQRVNTVSLQPKDNGCDMQVKMPDAGYRTDPEGPFRKRVGNTLAKSQPAKPPQTNKEGEKE